MIAFVMIGAGSSALALLSVIVIAGVLATRLHRNRRMVAAFVFALVIAGGLGTVARAEDFTDDDAILLPCPRWPEMTEWERWLCLATGWCDCD